MTIDTSPEALKELRQMAMSWGADRRYILALIDALEEARAAHKHTEIDACQWAEKADALRAQLETARAALRRRGKPGREEYLPGPAGEAAYQEAARDFAALGKAVP